MRNMIIPLILLALLIMPAVVGAAEINLNLTYPQFPGGPNINPNHPDTNQSLPALVAWLYVFIVGISGLAAFVMIVWGGVEYMTSAGNPTRTSGAKDKIKSALLGLLLVLASFLILQVINPELTLLRELP